MLRNPESPDSATAVTVSEVAAGDAVETPPATESEPTPTPGPEAVPAAEAAVAPEHASPTPAPTESVEIPPVQVDNTDRQSNNRRGGNNRRNRRNATDPGTQAGTTSQGQGTQSDGGTTPRATASQQPQPNQPDQPTNPAAEAPQQPTPPRTPDQPQFNPDVQQRFNRDTYNTERSRVGSLTVEQLEALRIELDPLRTDAQRSEDINGHVDAIRDQAARDQINGRLLAVDNLLAEKLIQRAQEGQPLTPEQQTHVLRNFVNNGRSSAMEQLYAQRLGFKDWQGALEHFNNGKGYTLTDAQGNKLFSVEEKQKSTRGLEAFANKYAPKFLQKALVEVARGGAVSLATWGAITALGGAVAWPVALAGAGAGAVAAIAGHWMKDKALYGKRANGKSMGEEAMQSAVEYMLQSRNKAHSALENQNLSELERAQVFNQIVADLRTRAVNRLDRSGVTDESLSGLENFEKTRKRWDFGIGAMRIGANLLGGGLMSWHEAAARVAEAKVHGVYMMNNHVQDMFSTANHNVTAPSLPVDSTVHGYHFALGHNVVFDKATDTWHAVMNKQDYAAAIKNYLVDGGKGPGFNASYLNHCWHYISPAGGTAPMNPSALTDLLSGSTLLHDGAVTDPTTEIFRFALTNGFENTGLLAGLNGLISAVTAGQQDELMMKRAEVGDERLRRMFQGTAGLRSTRPGSPAEVIPGRGAAGTAGAAPTPSGLPPMPSPGAPVAETGEAPLAASRASEAAPVREAERHLEEIRREMGGDRRSNPLEMYQDNFDRMRDVINREWPDPASPDNEIAFADAGDGAALREPLRQRLDDPEHKHVFIIVDQAVLRDPRRRRHLRRELGITNRDTNVTFLPRTMARHSNGATEQTPCNWQGIAEEMVAVRLEDNPELRLTIGTVEPPRATTEEPPIPEESPRREEPTDVPGDDPFLDAFFGRTPTSGPGEVHTEPSGTDEPEPPIDEPAPEGRTPTPRVEDSPTYNQEEDLEFLALSEDEQEEARALSRFIEEGRLASDAEHQRVQGVRDGIARRVQNHISYSLPREHGGYPFADVLSREDEGNAHSSNIRITHPDVVVTGDEVIPSLEGPGLLTLLFSEEELTAQPSPSAAEIYARAQYLQEYLTSHVDRYSTDRAENIAEAIAARRQELEASRDSVLRNRRLGRHARQRRLSIIGNQLAALNSNLYDIEYLRSRATVLLPVYQALQTHLQGRLPELEAAAQAPQAPQEPVPERREPAELLDPNSYRVEPISDFTLDALRGGESPEALRTIILGNAVPAITRYATYLRRLEEREDAQSLPDGTSLGSDLIMVFTTLNPATSSHAEMLAAFRGYRETRQQVIETMRQEDRERGAEESVEGTIILLDACNNCLVDLVIADLAAAQQPVPEDVTPEGGLTPPAEIQEEPRTREQNFLQGEALQAWMSETYARNPITIEEATNTSPQDLSGFFFSEAERTAIPDISLTELRDRIQAVYDYVATVEGVLASVQADILPPLIARLNGTPPANPEAPVANPAILEGNQLAGWLRQVNSPNIFDQVQSTGHLESLFFSEAERNGGPISRDLLIGRIRAFIQYVRGDLSAAELSVHDADLIETLQQRIETLPAGVPTVEIAPADDHNSVGDRRLRGTIENRLRTKLEQIRFELPAELMGNPVAYANLRRLVELYDDTETETLRDASLNRASVLTRLQIMRAAAEGHEAVVHRLEELITGLEAASLSEVSPQAPDVHGGPQVNNTETGS